ncbi:MAG: TonB-dependent receptor [Bacteroidales bacterium]|jgi:outer membrane receptor protein involved in Fe transport|nr:TonB-dependent receptor [Bacteroidales bacterium]
MKIKNIICLLFIYLTAEGLASAQTGTFELYGKITTAENGKIVPMDYATVALKPIGIYTTTTSAGKYSFSKLNAGKYELTVQMIGYKTIDTTINLSSSGKTKYDFKMQISSFRLKEVNIIASRSKAGEATASIISRQAIDHAQTSSLKDILQLLPGSELDNPDLAQSQTISLRTADPTSASSLGTAIIIDGSPVSNNANMEGINTAITGVSSSIASSGAATIGSQPNSGVDVRSISTDDIESVEVIRGIPSVQYGDLTSGAVIVKSKAGIEPLTVRIKTDPKIFQTYISKGMALGEKGGEIHFSTDYAYSNAKTTEAYAHYQRYNLKALWSKHFKNFNTNTSLEFKYGRDTRNHNPDDASSRLSSGGTNTGYRFASNGSWNINKGWLKSLNYDVSNSFTNKKSFKEQIYENAVYIYSTNMTSGTTLSNTKGKHIYDSEGNEITKFGPGQENEYATYTPYEYFSHYDFYGKELSTFAKLTLNFYKNWKNTSEKILLGADFQSDGNLGKGLVFNDDAPPLGNQNSGYRSRDLSDIPFVNRFGLFVENSFATNILKRKLNITAGLRLDMVNSLNTVTPRINASYEILPGRAILRGGYGITAKAPTSSYLYPNNAYYDQTNYNSINASDKKEQLVLCTTYIYDTKNPDLEIAKNRKYEAGLDLIFFKKYKLAVTFYDELMKNGYNFGKTFNTIKWLPYKYYTKTSSDADGYPVLDLTTDTHTFFTYYMPLNNNYIHNYGIEYELNLGRFDPIKTSFYINGAWMHTMHTDKGYAFDINSHSGSKINSNVAVYDPKISKYNYERFLSTLRITHNIPSIGFVVTLTAQANFFTKSWTNYHNDEIFQRYISNSDGQVYDFDPSLAGSDEFKYMIDQRSSSRFIKEKTKTTVVFNINVSKEIKDFLTASFYVNNLFNSRPLDRSERTNGSYTELNNPMYFGFEIKFKI